jgi:glucose/arabinose dehydrogenase
MRIAMGLVLAGLVVLTACGGGKEDDGPTPLPRCATPVNGTNVTAREIVRVNGGAMLVTAPREDPRLFVVEQNGRIRIVDEAGVLQPDPFLDIEEGYELEAGGESGLLGLAFHPQFHVNKTYFIYYTTNDANIVARCTTDAANPNTTTTPCTTVLSIPDFASNHNGGMIEFGPDGYLYIGTGDGGGSGDPNRNGQSLMDGSPMTSSVALLGKMLRIDVDRKANGKEYAIPSDNPFASGGGAPEIFIIGLRNPWRWSFDKETGDLWIGDVGQGEIEELTALPAGQQNGKNLGWSMYEGRECFRQPCSDTNMTFPQEERTHGQGWISVIGGETYRGTCYPDLVGWHFYTDYGAGGLYRARLQSNGMLEKVTVSGSFPGSVASIHADARGELYMTTTGGYVHHLEAGP